MKDNLRKVFDIVVNPSDEEMLGFGEPLGDNFSGRRRLLNVVVQKLNFHFKPRFKYAGIIERPLLRPENDCHNYAAAFKSGWREEHAKVLLHVLLELCKNGSISEGNVTDEAWLMIQIGLNNSTNSSFQIDFIKERLSDYKQLYSILTETSSPIYHWDRKKKLITIEDPDWREYHPELLLCGEHIPYFDTLEEVCLLLSTRRSSEQQVSENSTNIRNDQDIPQLSKIRTKFRKFCRRNM